MNNFRSAQYLVAAGALVFAQLLPNAASVVHAALPSVVEQQRAGDTLDSVASAALKAKLQVKLDSLHAAGRFPGGTFAVALPNGSVIAAATGMSDSSLKIRMKTSDLMPQGSVGKTYVSALAMQLIHENKLSLDAPISRYLGSETWFARLPNGAAITVRQLMNHTSGLVRYEFNPRFTTDLTSAPAEKRWDPRELIAYMFDAPVPFRPGEGWDYSDTNYMVLGMIIEKITGATLIGEIERRFIRPMRLTETVPNLQPLVPGIAQGYAGPRNPFGGTDAMLRDGRFSFNPAFEWAGGGWSSTTSDLVRWAKSLYEWRAFDSTLAPRFLDGVASSLGADVKYGLGVILWPAPPLAPSLGLSIGHSGFFPGYQTELRYFPSRRFATALQINSSNGRVLPRGMSGAIVELSALVAEHIGQLRRSG